MPETDRKCSAIKKPYRNQRSSNCAFLKKKQVTYSQNVEISAVFRQSTSLNKEKKRDLLNIQNASTNVNQTQQKDPNYFERHF